MALMQANTKKMTPMMRQTQNITMQRLAKMPQTKAMMPPSHDSAMVKKRTTATTPPPRARRMPTIRKRKAKKNQARAPTNEMAKSCDDGDEEREESEVKDGRR